MGALNEAAGLYPIAPTPFLPDGALDEASVGRMCERYLAAGATGLTVLGIMGEAPKLEPAEAIRVVRLAVAGMAGRPVVVGVSAPGFAAMRSLAREAMEAGAAGVMIAPTPTLRSDDSTLSYFAGAVAAIGAEVPWVLQDYPLTLSVVMTPGVIRRLAEAHPSMAMLKHEDWPGLEKITALRAQEAAGARRLSILTGNGGLFLDYETERGADGAMTGYAFPEMLAEVVRLQRAGEREAAHDLFDAHLPLLRYEGQPGVGLAVRKYVLTRRGFIANEAQRAPATVLTAAARAEVDHLLARLAKRDPRAAVG